MFFDLFCYQSLPRDELRKEPFSTDSDVKTPVKSVKAQRVIPRDFRLMSCISHQEQRSQHS